MSEIKFSVQTAVFRFYPLKLAMRRIAETGYDGIELGWAVPWILPRFPQS